MVLIHMRSYDDHLQGHLKEVASRLRSVDPEQFLAIIEHLRSVTCTAMEFQKADMMMKVRINDLFYENWGVGVDMQCLFSSSYRVV